MFGTMGFSELIIILVIVLIIFGAGKLPQIGEGIGKALKGFKKEVQDIPPPVDPQAVEGQQPQAPPAASAPSASPSANTHPGEQPVNPKTQPYQPGPELTPGTTAAMMYSGAGPEVVAPQTPLSQQASPSPASHVPPPPTMEQRAAAPMPASTGQYPPLPPTAHQTKPGTKRPSAIVNKQAVERVRAQQAALKAKQAQQAVSSGVPSPQEMQSLGEGLGSALRTFKEAAADVRQSIDPEMRTIQAELEAAEKEVADTIETAKQPVLPKDPPSTA